MPSFCEVALPVPLDRTFTYALRSDEAVSRGVRVIAPFRNEKLIGVVTATGVAAPTDFEAKHLEAVLDDEPLLSEHLLALAEWIAGYYLAPLGEVLRSMLPLMAEVRRTVYYLITDLGRDVLADLSMEREGSWIRAVLANSATRLEHPTTRAAKTHRWGFRQAQTPSRGWRDAFWSDWLQESL